MYTIGELAKAAGVASSTIRFYERRGLLSPQGRTGANYRTYSAESLDTLRFILAGKRLGFTLGDISRLLRVRDGSRGRCGDIKSVIAGRLAAIQDKIRDLRQAEQVLGRSLDSCARNDPSGSCPVLESLAQPPG